MAATRPLTELEGAALGVVWQRGPCSGYAVRKVFVDSRNPHWSGSQGAIYPLLERLEVRGLVTGKRRARDPRNGRAYSITRRGLRRLREWIDRPDDPLVLASPADPVRTRVVFLGALEPGRRTGFLRDLHDRLGALAARHERGGDIESRLADTSINRVLNEATQASLKTRARWLERVIEVAHTLGGKPGS